MKTEQGTCPVCGSHNVDYGELQFPSDIIFYPITCRDCGAKSEERYEMLYIGNFEEGEDE